MWKDIIGRDYVFDADRTSHATKTNATYKANTQAPRWQQFEPGLLHPPRELAGGLPGSRLIVSQQFRRAASSTTITPRLPAFPRRRYPKPLTWPAKIYTSNIDPRPKSEDSSISDIAPRYASVAVIHWHLVCVAADVDCAEKAGPHQGFRAVLVSRLRRLASVVSGKLIGFNDPLLFA